MLKKLMAVARRERSRKPVVASRASEYNPQNDPWSSDYKNPVTPVAPTPAKPSRPGPLPITRREDTPSVQYRDASADRMRMYGDD